MLNRKNKIIKRFFTGIEIALIVVLIGGAGLGVSNFKQKRALKKSAAQNAEQAVQIDKLVVTVDEVNKKKDEVAGKLHAVEEEIKAKASTGFSILYEQAVDIEKDHPSTYTEVHTKTAKELVKVWGYDAMARIIKWQQDQIAAQIQETKRLMNEKDKLKTEYLEYKVKTTNVINETKGKAEEHRQHAETLKGQVSNYLSENGWLNKVLFWAMIGGGGYLFVTFGGIPLFFSMKNKAVRQVQEQLQKEKEKKKDAMKSIKAFKAANQDGNDTMDRILTSMKVDAEKDDD
jgi:hypothetical protein